MESGKHGGKTLRATKIPGIIVRKKLHDLRLKKKKEKDVTV